MPRGDLPMSLRACKPDLHLWKALAVQRHDRAVSWAPDEIRALVALTPGQRGLRARLAAHARWAKTVDRTAATAAARAGIIARFEREVDPEGVLNPEVRARLAENARRQFLARKAKGPGRKAAPPPADRPAAQKEVISDPDQVTSDTGTGDLERRIPVSQITPPRERPHHDPETNSHHSAPIPARGDAGGTTSDTYQAFAERRRRRMIEGGLIGEGDLSPEDEQFARSMIGRDYVTHVVGTSTHRRPRSSRACCPAAHTPRPW